MIDTTNGDVVHVDFNCLFGMVSTDGAGRRYLSNLTLVPLALRQGLVWFDIVEKVPFRLTQNMIDGFGITGVEGVFRKCSEISVRVLRESKNSLISVLESFVHDPLLDLQLSRPGVSGTAEAPHFDTVLTVSHDTSVRRSGPAGAKPRSRRQPPRRKHARRRLERRLPPLEASSRVRRAR